MGKTAFLFSGQGAQKPGMGADLLEKSAAAREVFRLANETLGTDIQALCQSGPQEELNRTIHTQPCTLACDLAAARALMENGVAPEGCAGFSLGEFAALAVGGAFSDARAFSLIAVRAQAMQAACEAGRGGMAAIIGGDTEAIEALCAEIGDTWPVNYNCPGQLVVAGEKDALARFLAVCAERKWRAMPLPVSGAFHSPLMVPAQSAVLAAAQEQLPAPTALPVYGNEAAAPYPADPAEMAALMARQLTRPVRWEQTIRAMVAEGYTRFIECGFGGTLTGFFKRMKLDVEVLPYTAFL